MAVSCHQKSYAIRNNCTATTDVSELLAEQHCVPSVQPEAILQ